MPYSSTSNIEPPAGTDKSNPPKSLDDLCCLEPRTSNIELFSFNSKLFSFNSEFLK